ncbi:substrate-binding domain-containing protein [Anaerotalea alkaliphila]|uniref:Sugar ABC transporter substrate-binding protein n=1 Tax=Anaerotalea alkaliphila TaxID=2662126 RepID=A0A7X5KMG5_9FIRM|nr:substrate-binding domain-containing protein [Anaerotalea alkaliphila]NDL67804.1 sugar ABC transporter substrate-binding protein [Anaerotalea alkaliphila]
MREGRKIVVAGVAMVVGLLLVAGAALGMQGMQGQQETRMERVGLVLASRTDPHCVSMAYAARAKAAEMGVELLVEGPELPFDGQEQLEVMDRMIEAGVDRLLVAPTDPDTLVVTVRKANDRNIPVVVLDRGLEEDAMVLLGAYTYGFIDTRANSLGIREAFE